MKNMELRSNRSRSKTPYLLTEGEEEMYEQHIQSEETIIQHAYSTRSRNIVSTGSDEVFISPQKQKSRSIRRSIESRARQKTSDYSSEEGENEISSSRAIENDSRRRLTYTSKPSNGEMKTAFQIYKEAGEYWNKFPKTDYTYSRHSKDRVEVAPGIIAMPNMSRRSLHRDIDGSQHSSHTDTQYYTETSGKIDYEETKQHHTRLEPRKLFDDDVQQTVISRLTRTVTSTFVKIYMSILTIFTAVYRSNTSVLLWFGKAYYRLVSRVLLLDTWLLQSSVHHRRRMGAVLALLLLPLFILAGWWMCSSVSNALFAAVPISTEATTTGILLEDNIPLIPNIYIPSQTEAKESVNVEEIVRRILENPAFEHIIVKHLTNKESAIKEQSVAINALKSDMNQIHNQLNFVSANNARLSQNINKCCRRQYVHIEGYVTRILSDLIGKPGLPLKSEEISNWLHTLFVAKQDLEISLSNITKNIHGDLDKLVEVSAKKIMDDVTLKIRAMLKDHYDMDNVQNVEGGISELHVKRLVKQALAVYDADKTGMVDYALESSGGQVLSTRCTESYNARTAELSVLGIPLWYPSNTPRTVISPEVTPGKCWAFQGFPGFLVLQLTAKIKVSAFSLEHIPKTLAPDGRRDSAPKDFVVYGLTSENDHDPWLLGKYEYDFDGPGLQYFPVQNEGPAFNLVELRVDSNHGNLIYTCLYRFRVHGIVSKEIT